MSRVTAAVVIRDKMPRRLWELKLQCGHTNYELVEQTPKAPVEMLCRVCQAEARLAAFRARVASWAARRGRGAGAQPVLSGPSAEGLLPAGTMPFELDGGLDVRLADPPQAPPPLAEDVGWVTPEDREAPGEDPDAAPAEAEIPREARALPPLPACMQPRPGSLVPGSGNRSSGQGVERTGRARGQGSGPAKGSPKAKDPGQGRLFES
jgi:hypothetical protein